MVICLEQSADLHMAQLMPLPLTIFCFSKVQIGFTLLVPAHLHSPGDPDKGPLNGLVCVCVCVIIRKAVNQCTSIICGQFAVSLEIFVGQQSRIFVIVL